MGELDELIVKFLKEELGDDADLAIKLYMAYKDGGRKELLKVINELLKEVNVEVNEGES